MSLFMWDWTINNTESVQVVFPKLAAGNASAPPGTACRRKNKYVTNKNNNKKTKTKLSEVNFPRVPEPQNDWGWKGLMEVIWPNPTA